MRDHRKERAVTIKAPVITPVITPVGAPACLGLKTLVENDP